jgi:hypothetical protein
MERPVVEEPCIDENAKTPLVVLELRVKDIKTTGKGY